MSVFREEEETVAHPASLADHEWDGQREFCQPPALCLLHSCASSIFPDQDSYTRCLSPAAAPPGWPGPEPPTSSLSETGQGCRSFQKLLPQGLPGQRHPQSCWGSEGISRGWRKPPQLSLEQSQGNPQSSPLQPGRVQKSQRGSRHPREEEGPGRDSNPPEPGQEPIPDKLSWRNPHTRDF